MKNFMVTIAAMALLAGCSTTPLATSDTAPVPPERLLSQAYSKPGKETGTLVIKRDTGLAGSACNWIISYNGTDLAILASGESFALHPPAGEATVGARPRAALCPGTMIETTILISPGKVRAMRLGMDWNGVVRFGPTTQ